MTHIVFQQADIDVLKKAFELDESMNGDIIEIKDDYAIGPLGDLDEAEGWQARRDWWKELLTDSPYGEQLNIVDDKLAFTNLKRRLDEGETVWIWMGQNQHDVSGYYWLISQLKDYQGQLYVLYLNNLPFINEKGGIFYPTSLHEIQPKEFLKAKKLARVITSSELEVDPDEWKKLCNENAAVRILEGGKKIVSKEEDFYDKELLSFVAEPQKLFKFLSNALGKMKIKTGDVFLVWRLKQLMQQGKLVLEGDWAKGWKEIVVRKEGSTKEATGENVQ